LAIGGVFFNVALTAALPPGVTTPTSLIVTLNKVELQATVHGNYDKVLIDSPATLDVIRNLGQASGLINSGTANRATYNGIRFTLAATGLFSGTDPCTGDAVTDAVFQLAHAQSGQEIVRYEVPHPILLLPSGALPTQPFTLGADPLNVRLVFPVSNSLGCISDSPALRTIVGHNTLLAGPFSIYHDPLNDEIGVTNTLNNSITVYQRTDSGDIAPLRTIQGQNTGLDQPAGIFVYNDVTDSSKDEIGATNANSNSITIYQRADNGDIAPMRTIVGAATGIDGPGGMFLDKTNDEILVANGNNDSITIYNRSDDGNVPPQRTIQGSNTGLNAPCGVYVDEVNGEIVVANNAGNSITVYGIGADGNVNPLRTPISGSNTGLRAPCGIAVDANSNEIAVTNTTGNTVTYYSRTATGDVSPLRRIRDAGLNVPTGLYLDATNGELGIVNKADSSIAIHSNTDSSPHLFNPPIYINPTLQQNLYVNLAYAGNFDKVTGQSLSVPTFQGYGYVWFITDSKLRQTGDAGNAVLIQPSNIVFGMAPDNTPASNLNLGCAQFTPFITLQMFTACKTQPLILTPFPPPSINYRVAATLLGTTQVKELPLYFPPHDQSEIALLEPTIILSSSGSILEVQWQYVDQLGQTLPDPLLFSQQFQITLTRPYTDVSTCYQQVAGNNLGLVFASGSLTPDVRSLSDIQNNRCDIFMSDVDNISFTATDAYGNSYVFTWKPT
jgi:DNA-binding beta-propeller fold protein YncE